MKVFDLSSLNDTQRQAVEWEDGPLLVLAGPGSGKTWVLTCRIAKIIAGTVDETFRILGLTFTNKAAAEMRDRIESLVANAGDRVLISTFHSFAGDILRQHGHLIGLRPDFTILVQESDRLALLEEAIVATKGLDPSDYRAERVLPVMTRLLDFAADESNLSELSSELGGSDHAALAAIYLNYRRLMIQHNSLDFGGLIAEALGILRKRQVVRRQIQRIYRYVCVDEFQDTNQSQYEILRRLINPTTKNVFVVADDDQIIYQWNGASPERLAALRREFGMTVLQLPQNYRCPPDVIHLANRLIVHNLGRTEGKQALVATKKMPGRGGTVRLMPVFNTFEDEAKWVAQDIADRDPAAQSKCVVLARARRLLEQIVSDLEEAGVPAYLAMRKDEFVSSPMRWLHAILRLANARQDGEQLRRVCKAFFTLEGVDINVKDVVAAAGALDGDFLRAFTQAALTRQLEPSTRSLMKSGLPRLSEKLDFKNFIADAFKWIDTIPQITPQSAAIFSEYPEEKAIWAELFNDIAAQFGQDQMTLHLLLQELDMRSKTPKPAAGAIPCFTIHAAKGLEFDHVYLVGLVEDQLPSWAAVKKGNDSLEMQEERRNCFVAITRTQESLTLTFSRRVQGWQKEPSRFLREMGLISGR